jgi:hypothetical protein
VKHILLSYAPKFKAKNLKGLLLEFPAIEAPGVGTSGGVGVAGRETEPVCAYFSRR